MKNPESPRAYPASTSDPLRVEVRDEKIVPRYVQAPALRDHGMGPRNLFWGVVMLIFAVMLLIVAVFFVGPRAMIYVATCLITFTALFVLTRIHLFRQRNGGFLALAMVCLIGTAIPLVEKAFSSAKSALGSRESSSTPTVTMHSQEADAPLLTQSFALPLPQGEGKQVRVLRDSRVVIAEKPFLIKTGDRFPFVAIKGDEATFSVRDLLVSLPANVVEVVDPTALAKGVGITQPETPGQPATTAANPIAGTPKVTAAAAIDADLAEVTRNAQQDAMRKYPALAVKDSMENDVFVSTYKQMRDAGNDTFFADPKWPMKLADLLAHAQGWVPGAGPMTTRPDPVLDPPAAENAAPPALIPDDVPVARPVAPARRPPTNLPPISALDAGSDLPRATR